MLEWFDGTEGESKRDEDMPRRISVSFTRCSLSTREHDWKSLLLIRV